MRKRNKKLLFKIDNLFLKHFIKVKFRKIIYFKLLIINYYPLNRYLTIYRLKELAEFKLGDTVKRFKSRFKNDSTAATIRDLLWNLEENRHHIQVMLEPMAYRFPEADNLKTPYDNDMPY